MSTKGRGPQVDPEGRGSSPTMKGLDPPRPFNNIRLPWAGRRKPPRRSLVQRVARRSCEGRVQKPGTCFAAPAQEWRRAAVLLEEVCEDADEKPADPQAAEMAGGAQQSAGDGSVSAEAGGVYARLYDHAKEAEFSAAEGRAGSPHQRIRGYELHSRRGSQPAGAFGGIDPRWPRQRPARGALSHHPRHP